MKPRPKKKNPTTNPAPISPSLRDQILADFTTLRVPVTADQLDAALDSTNLTRPQAKKVNAALFPKLNYLRTTPLRSN